MYLPSCASIYANRKKDDAQIELMKSKGTLFPVSYFLNLKINPNIIVLKNELREIWKRSQPCIVDFRKVSKLKSREKHYVKFLQLYMS